MLVYRRRRWTNIKPALAQGIVLAGMLQLMGHHLPNAGECLMIYVYLLIKLTCHALNHNTSPHYMNEIYLTFFYTKKNQVIVFNFTQKDDTLVLKYKRKFLACRYYVRICRLGRMLAVAVHIHCSKLFEGPECAVFCNDMSRKYSHIHTCTSETAHLP